jgi:uncharacterized protein (TIGR00645 family)
MYIGLVVGMVVVLIKFFQELIVLVAGSIEASPHDIVLGLLGLLDLALLGNLILIVIFAGYENFVSKIGVAERSEDRPQWMGHVDFSGLKIKLIGSLVAISVIELLQDFMKAGEEVLDWRIESWRIGLHLTFVISGVLFAVMDYLADKRKILFDAHRAELEAAGHGATHKTGDGI